jgi:hypothetical protein
MSTYMSKITRTPQYITIGELTNPDKFDCKAERNVFSHLPYQIPENQRWSSWDLEAKKHLIDSIMYGYPITGMLVAESIMKNEKNGKPFNVKKFWDGNSRLDAAQRYRLGEFTWNDKFYDELSEEDRSEFKNYLVTIEAIHAKEDTTDEEFERICQMMFIRTNHGKKLSDADKYYNYHRDPIVMLVYTLKKEAEFSVDIKRFFGDVGGNKNRTYLAEFVAIIIAIMRKDIMCITTKYDHNSCYVVSNYGTDTAIVVTPDKVNEVRKFLRFYFSLANTVIATEPKLKKIIKRFGRIVGPILSDWIEGHAQKRIPMWVDFIIKSKDDKYEKKIYKLLSKGDTQNTGQALIKRVQCIVDAFDRRKAKPTIEENSTIDEELKEDESECDESEYDSVSDEDE